MPSAIVTGSTGFTGSRLVDLLKREGVEVHKVSARSEGADLERVDFRDPRQLSRLLGKIRPHYIFHLSGLANSEQLASFVEVNCLHAAALIDALDGAGLPNTRVLMVGSAAEYGRLDPAAIPAREDGPTAPTSPYGITKLAQTQLALGAARHGLRITLARPSNIIGPGMPPNLALASFARQLAEIEAGIRDPILEVGDLSTIRDFIDVADAVEIYWKLLNAACAAGEVVNVASGQGVRLGTALEALLRIFNLEVQIRHVPQRGGSPDVPTFVASPDRLLAAIGPYACLPLERSLHAIAEHERSAVRSK